jgi:hypothetical protein
MKSSKFFQYLIVSVVLQSVLIFAANKASASYGPPNNPDRIKTGPVDVQRMSVMLGSENLLAPGQTTQMGGKAQPPQNQSWPTVSGKSVADLYPSGSDPWFDKKNKIPKSAIKFPDAVISSESWEIMKGLTNKDETPYPVTGPSLGVTMMKAALLENALGNEPQRAMHDAEIQGQAQATQAGDAAADTARGQAASAISFCSSYLENFTTQPQWNMVRDQIFVPMAILLLLPGAVLAQARAIVAAGSPVLGEVNPFEGILRSIVAIFLIPATALVVNYGIDLNNSIAYTIQTEYNRIFGSDMYRDALCAEMRATPVRQSQSNRNALDQTTYQGKPLLGGTTPFAQFEGAMMENSIQDPCAGINQAPAAGANENMQSGMIATRMMMNGSNASLTAAWNILCAFQLAYLYYLWCVGPIMAALWVYPLRTLRNALPSWVEGVVTLCFWSLFWNTVILLIACFKGVDETGTMITTALNFLATASVKYAFDFAGLVKAAGQEAAGMAAGQAKNAAAAGGGGGHGGGAQRHGGASHGGRRSAGALASARNGGGGREYAANLSGRGREGKLADATVGGGGNREAGVIKASFEGPSMPSRSILEAASNNRGFEAPKEGANKRTASAAMDKIETPPLVARDKGVGDRLASIDSPIKMNPSEPGVHRDAQGRITGIDVAGNDSVAAFGMLAAAQAKDEAARAGSTDGRSVDGIEGRGGVDGQGLAGQGFAGLTGAGQDGNDGGAGLVLASFTGGGASDAGLTDRDVLRTASMGIMGAGAAKDGVIHPMHEGVVAGVNAHPNHDLAAKKPLDLGLTGLNPDHDHAKTAAVGGLLLNGGLNGDLNVPANALVGLPPSAGSGYDAFGNPTNVDLSRSMIDGSLTSIDGSQTSFDSSNLTAIDSDLTQIDSSLTSIDSSLTAIDSGMDVNNLSSLSTYGSVDGLTSANVQNYDAGSDVYNIDANQLTAAQLNAMSVNDATTYANYAADNGMITTTGLGRDGIDGVGAMTAMPINAGDTLVHYPQSIDASQINNASAISANGAMNDLIQQPSGTVADTALSSQFAMFGRDTSVNTSVDIWTPNQPINASGASIDQTFVGGQGQGAPISYDYNAGSIDQSMVTNNGGSTIDQSMVTAQANGGAANYEYNASSSAMFNPTSISDLTNNNSCQVSVDNGSYLTPTGAVQLQGGGNEYVASNQQYDNNSFASSNLQYDNSSSASYETNNSCSVDNGAAYSNASSFATYSAATIDSSSTVDGSQVYNAAGSQYADNSQMYNNQSTQGGSTDIAYSSAPAISNDTSFSSAPTTYNNDIAYGSSATHNNNDVNYGAPATHYNNDVNYTAPATQYSNDVSYSAPATHYNNDVTYSAPATQQYDTSGANTADNAKYAAYSTGGYAADANWTTNFSAAPTAEGDSIAYNNTYGADAAQAPSRSTDSWFDSGNTNIASAAAAPMTESPRGNEAIGHSDLGIAMPIVPKQIFASAEPSAPASVAKAPLDAPRTLAMNTTKAVNANKLTAAMGRAAGQTRNGVPAANNQTVVASNGAAANGVVPARTAGGAQEYARYQPQAPNGNEPPPVFDHMPDSLQNHLMLANQRGGRIQKSDVDEEATMKMRLDQMTGFNSTPV